MQLLTYFASAPVRCLNFCDDVQLAGGTIFQEVIPLMASAVPKSTFDRGWLGEANNAAINNPLTYHSSPSSPGKRVPSPLKSSSSLPCCRYVPPAGKIVTGVFISLWCDSPSSAGATATLIIWLTTFMLVALDLRDTIDYLTRWTRTGSSIDPSLFQFSYCRLVIERKKYHVVFKVTTTTRSRISHFQILSNKSQCVYRSGNSASIVLILVPNIFLIEQWHQFRTWWEVSLEREWQSKSVCR